MRIRLPGLMMAAAVLAFVQSSQAHAQVVRGDQVVVSANMISRDSGAIPRVSFIVRADFVLFTVSLESGLRSQPGRENELIRTFQSYTQRANRSNDVDIEVGQPGNSA